MAICKWCGQRVLGGPLPNGYCSSGCNIEDLENVIAGLRAEITDSVEEAADLEGENTKLVEIVANVLTIYPLPLEVWERAKQEFKPWRVV